MTARPYSVIQAERPDWFGLARDLFVEITVESTDAAGDLTLVGHEGRPTLGPGRAANALRERDETWRANPRCVMCATTIPSPTATGFVQTPDGPRVACKLPCYIAALRKFVLPPLVRHAVAAQPESARAEVQP